MKITICVLSALLFGYLFSDKIRKNNIPVYILASTISVMAIMHSFFKLSGYSVEYFVGLKQIMRAIESGALGGAFFIVVMYLGVVNMKYEVCKRLKIIRAELSIIACIFTIPHNFYYFFDFIKKSELLDKMGGFSIWTNLMVFASAIFAIGIMLPLFITSFKFFRKKMSGSKWKNLQQFAYIFYAMIYVQVVMVYISRPLGLDKVISLIFYNVVFISYTILKVNGILEKNRKKKVLLVEKKG